MQAAQLFPEAALQRTRFPRRGPAPMRGASVNIHNFDKFPPKTAFFFQSGED